MKSEYIRKAFLNFFERHGHTKVNSSSLIPDNDPTILFTNSGMVPFKNIFLGKNYRYYSRATSVQRCVRAGGKHNDLNNVGYTGRHHTFFEMLGNFSFGDYFKYNAIILAWKFLIEELKIPKEKLWVTVHNNDYESLAIWVYKIGIPINKLIRLNKDNFWQMGKTGPCGPSTEIFYDYGNNVFGSPPGTKNAEGNRYIEIWNIVFMQFEKDVNGNLKNLPIHSIDTGMGLERISAVMLNIKLGLGYSNYEIDLFQNIIKATINLLGNLKINYHSLRVISDHIRSSSFLISDGIRPSNKGRGYVLRRIIRRAVLHGKKLGISNFFFYKLVKVLDLDMGYIYPELRKSINIIEIILLKEEKQFINTLYNSINIFKKLINSLKENNVIKGKTIFKFHDTYGLPYDLIYDIAIEYNLKLDKIGFERELNDQRKRIRSSNKFYNNDFVNKLNIKEKTIFTGYDNIKNSGKIIAILNNYNKLIKYIKMGEYVNIILDKTPFYAESGGQISDIGYIINDKGYFKVIYTQNNNINYLHYGLMVKGKFKLNEKIEAIVNKSFRIAIMKNHSATHLLHEALRQVIGEHVQQKGSLITSDYLRFDINHFNAINTEQIKEIENIVNKEIITNTIVNTRLIKINEAKNIIGSRALFENKYNKIVRVVIMGNNDFSIELCGGTHVSRTGNIGVFNIISESSVAFGIRRIEAVTGELAINKLRKIKLILKNLSLQFKVSINKIENQFIKIFKINQLLEKKIIKLKFNYNSKLNKNELCYINEIKILLKKIYNCSNTELICILNKFKKKIFSGLVILINFDYIFKIIIGVTKNLINIIKANEIVNFIIKKLGVEIKGGGNFYIAQLLYLKSYQLKLILYNINLWLKLNIRIKNMNKTLY
ncbi:Alanyl-tRNA synthetase [Candidatus Johnevansia muelleri]|uniref:Alanine--tRNA ligase n=1 Tax=Candidatus Johnevansia muelleri TaxID=1495769 RepID=A0A078KI93_9GAMM|nr:Alanyl-tRNA synthetase [Candidatus Evansia muelleri]